MGELIPKILGFGAGFAVLGGIIAGVVMWGINKHIETLNENAKLRHKDTENEISKVRVELLSRIGELDLKFQTLATDVKGSSTTFERGLEEQRKLYTRVTAAVLRQQNAAEKRFAEFQVKMTEIKVLCDRLKKEA